MGENIAFAFSYQLGWMYLRYFMWNFAGKQNDLQGIYMGNVRDGNWKTGIRPMGYFPVRQSKYHARQYKE
ncbi:MAG: hypothetical protein WDM90_14320 [Ferruginibacter sp.]